MSEPCGTFNAVANVFKTTINWLLANGAMKWRRDCQLDSICNHGIAIVLEHFNKFLKISTWYIVYMSRPNLHKLLFNSILVKKSKNFFILNYVKKINCVEIFYWLKFPNHNNSLMPIEKIHSKKKINPESVTSLNSTICCWPYIQKREYRQKMRSVYGTIIVIQEF